MERDPLKALVKLYFNYLFKCYFLFETMSSRRPHTSLTQLLQYLNGDTAGIEAGQFFIVRDGPKQCTLPL